MFTVIEVTESESRKPVFGRETATNAVCADV